MTNKMTFECSCGKKHEIIIGEIKEQVIKYNNVKDKDTPTKPKGKSHSFEEFKQNFIDDLKDKATRFDPVLVSEKQMKYIEEFSEELKGINFKIGAY